MTDAKKFDEGFEKPPSNWIKWGKVNNAIKAVYIDQRIKTSDGEDQIIYDIQGLDGDFNDIIDKVVQEKVTPIEKGAIYQLGGKTMIDNQLRNIKKGQEFIARYVSDYDLGNGKIAKTIEIKLGGMNAEYLKELENGKVEEVAF